MFLRKDENTVLSIPGTLRLIGIFGGILGLMITTLTTLVYLHDHPDFSILVSRNTPVIWEWLCFFSSIAWVFAHSLILGKDQ